MPTTNGHEVEFGCVLDNHFGWHNHARMIFVAHDLGWPLTLEDHQLVDRYDNGDQNDPDQFEIVNDLMDEAERWLNANTTEGYLWHWSNGDFFLSPWCGGEDPDCHDDTCAHWCDQ